MLSDRDILLLYYFGISVDMPDNCIITFRSKVDRDYVSDVLELYEDMMADVAFVNSSSIGDMSCEDFYEASKFNWMRPEVCQTLPPLLELYELNTKFLSFPYVLFKNMDVTKETFYTEFDSSCEITLDLKERVYSFLHILRSIANTRGAYWVQRSIVCHKNDIIFLINKDSLPSQWVYGSGFQWGCYSDSYYIRKLFPKLATIAEGLKLNSVTAFYYSQLLDTSKNLTVSLYRYNKEHIELTNDVCNDESQDIFRLSENSMYRKFKTGGWDNVKALHY